MKDTSDSKRRPGETAQNHRTRIRHTAPHLARQMSPKLPHGAVDVRDGKSQLNNAKTGLPKVQGWKHHD
jgi:hypothetical protein